MASWIDSSVQASAAAAARVGPLAPGFRYVLNVKSNDVWFKQGDSTVVATAGAGSHYVKVGQAFEFSVRDATDGYISVIRDSADGTVILSRLRES